MSFRRLGLRGPLLFGVGLVVAACASATGTGEDDQPRGRPDPAAGAAGEAGTGGAAGKAASAGKAGSAGAIGVAGQGGEAGASSGASGAAGTAPGGAAGASGAAGAGGSAGTSGSAGATGKAGSGGAAGTGGAAGKAGSSGSAGQGGGGKSGAGGTGGTAGTAGAAGVGGANAGAAGEGGRAGTGGDGGSGGTTAGSGGSSGGAGQSGAAGAGGGTVPIVCHDPCVAGPPMDTTCGPAIIFDACGPNGVGNKECCTTGWTDACVAFTDAVVGCAGRSPGYDACIAYEQLPTPSEANKEACDACRDACYDLADCGGNILFPGYAALELECNPLKFPLPKPAEICACLTKPSTAPDKGCMGKKGAACCLSEGAMHRCLATTCKTECAP